MVTYNIQKSDSYNKDDDPYNNQMYGEHIAKTLLVCTIVIPLW